MIYTLTLNPAIDYYITVNDLNVDKVNRTDGEYMRFGGKGINVSLVLKELGIRSIALGFVGGFTGQALQDHLAQLGITCDFVKVAGNTRINVKLNETDINATGPDISFHELEELYHKLDKIKKGDFLVLSGSVPKTLPQNIYEDILKGFKNKGVNFVVDAEGELLLGTLKYSPFLIKPNHHELGNIFGVEIKSFDDACVYAKKLQEKGARNVMVTMGEKGAVLIDENGGVCTHSSPNGDVISAVGSGDSSVAAFLAKYLSGDSYKNCLAFAVAAGSATAFSSGLATKDEIIKILGEIL